MTDQSVRREKRSDDRARTQPSGLQGVAQEPGPEEIPARCGSQVVERFFQPDRSREEILEAMVSCLLAARDLGRHGVLSAQFPVSDLIEALREVAERKHIRPESFYATVLEGVITESEEVSRAVSRHSTKDKILEAALEVFSEKGFHLATVDEIAERADLGKGTLYRYFANKETLFNELVRLRLEDSKRMPRPFSTARTTC